MSDLNAMWVEKFRPHKIEDCILPEAMKRQFADMVQTGVIPNMTMTGGPGMGKTTVARAIADEMDASYILVNASKDGNIDTIRTKITDFCSTISFNGQRKLVILDEADGMNALSMQPALRGCIEEFLSNASFILTANFENKILKPILSRCPVIRFKVPKEERKTIAANFFKRVESILKTEGVDYDRKVVAQVVQHYFPDFRETLGILQQYKVGGKIDAGILAIIKDADIKELMGALKAKEFSAMRQWVAVNIDQDPARLFRKVYDAMYEHLQPASIPALVLILADYQYKCAFVADQEINTVACMTQIMSECEFK